MAYLFHLLCIVCMYSLCVSGTGTTDDTTIMTDVTMTATDTWTTEPTTNTPEPTTTTKATTTPASTTMTTKPETTNPTRGTGTTSKTTEPVTTTPTQGQTTAGPTQSPVWPPAGTWTVADDEGAVCMKMSFSAKIYITYQNKSNIWTQATIDVPKTAVPHGSVCGGDGEPRHFVLHLFNAANYWYLNFTYGGETKYALEQVRIAWTYDNQFTNPKDQSKRRYEFADNGNFLNKSIPLARTFTCGNGLMFQTTVTTVLMKDVQLMPYAENSEGDFGKDLECGSEKSTNVGLIVGICVGVFALFALFGLVFAVAKYKSSRTGAEDLQRIVN